MTKTLEDRLGAFLLAQIEALDGKPPPSLYHYTSSAGMRAIIASGVLRAHNIGQMNDFAEARYAASVMRAQIDRQYALEANLNADCLFAVMRDQMSSLDLSNVFVLSFTSDGDELGMWKLYADRGQGFSFALPILPALEWAAKTHQGFFARCSYCVERLEEFCRSAVATIREIFLADIAAGIHPDPVAYCEAFFRNVAWFAPVFKPRVWEDEKEWRFVFTRPQCDHKTIEGGKHCIELPLRPSDEASFGPLTAICAGPNCDYEADILPLQAVLVSKGYDPSFAIHLARGHVTRPGRRPPNLRN